MGNKLKDKDGEACAIIGGFFDGQVLDSKGVVAVSKLPTKQELMQQTAVSLRLVPSVLPRGSSRPLPRSCRLPSSSPPRRWIKHRATSLQRHGFFYSLVLLPAAPRLRVYPRWSPTLREDTSANSPLHA